MTNTTPTSRALGWFAVASMSVALVGSVGDSLLPAAAGDPLATQPPPPIKQPTHRHRYKRGHPFSCRPTPHAKWTRERVKCIIRDVFGKTAPAGLAVARCESDYDPTERMRSSTASGVFQFLDSTWRMTKFSRFSVYSPIWNVRAAYDWSSGGTRWDQWVCKPWWGS